MKTGAALHPGQINAFDGATYDTLVTVQAALKQATAEATQFPQFKPQINQAAAAYDTAIAAFKTYHAAAAAGTATADQQASLQQTVAALVASVAQIEAAFGVKP